MTMGDELRRRFGLDAPYAHIVVPLVTFLLLASLSLLIWRGQVVMLKADMFEDTLLIADGFARRCQVVIQDQLRPVRRLARDVGSGMISTGVQFTTSAQSIQRGVPGLTEIAWIDEKARFAP